MIISEKGVITRAYKKRGGHHIYHKRAYPTIVPQGVPYIHIPCQALTPLHCPPLSETPPSHLTSKTGLPKHSIGIVHTTSSYITHTPISSNTHYTPLPLSADFRSLQSCFLALLRSLLAAQFLPTSPLLPMRGQEFSSSSRPSQKQGRIFLPGCKKDIVGPR